MCYVLAVLANTGDQKIDLEYLLEFKFPDSSSRVLDSLG